ncbi:MAG TPA: Gfo/Idh/MocA family oxidoreductase [Allosphingosinicella sp.]|nr:Gfo/Idh/MocA family oxidoreductase [Allosphingosinicella sp.]
MPIRIAIVGYGKIAKDQHVPSIAADPRFELVAVAGPRVRQEGELPVYASHQALIADLAGRLDAVAVCTPPGIRHAIARDVLAAGLHCLLEKPPTATLGEIEDLERLAAAAGRSLFTAWHSQHNPAVAAARAALAGQSISELRIQWFEDVRKWHPGQEWIWRPGGFGVFDPGINALSIATRILPMPLFVREAKLLFPANRQTPIAASLDFVGDAGAFAAEMDWRYTEGERWTIDVRTAGGRSLQLLDGGSRLLVDGKPRAGVGRGEYPSIYERFATLVESGESEVDREPLRVVADAFLVGAREEVEPFD